MSFQFSKNFPLIQFIVLIVHYMFPSFWEQIGSTILILSLIPYTWIVILSIIVILQQLHIRKLKNTN